MQRPSRLIVAGLEQVGTDRLQEGGIVNEQRDIVARFLADAFPGGVDLRSIVIAEMNAIVGRVLGVGMLGGNEHQFGIDRELMDAAGIAGFGAGESTDL